MSGHPDFTADIYQNEYLPEGAREVDAIVTVTAAGSAGAVAAAGPSGEAAEVIIVDCSGSMDYPATKMSAAREGTKAAIDVLRDGTRFAVVAGTEVARIVYPVSERLVPANDRTRAEAKAAVARLSAGGGTAIGQWLQAANRLFRDAPDAIRHAILLTDGKNEHETAESLDRAIALSEGRFTCDCRGVGDKWVVAELRKVSSALLGSVDIIADPADLEADFRAMATASMNKAVAGVALRLWTPQGATVRFVKQVAPVVEDLTGKRVVSGPQSGDYPLGSWGDESRDYHVGVEVKAGGGVGDEMLAGRISLVIPDASGPGQVLTQGLVKAIWTDDMALSTRINPEVAHYTGQAELADAIQDGLEARKSGDLDTATAKLGRAVQLAAESGNEGTAKLLEKVVDVLDPATGTVRLKSRVEAADEMALDTRSTKTVRVKKS